MSCSQQLIANELLAFVQHAIDTMDEISIIQICKTGFKEQDISAGKKLLYQTLNKLDQMPSHRRDGTEKSIQEIISLLKVTDPDDVPTFVAKDLHKLPPVTFDHVDVTRLLKDITSLKSSLAEVQSKLEKSDSTIIELREEIASLRSAICASRSPDFTNVNTRRGAQNASIGSFESANLVASPAANNASDVTHTRTVTDLKSSTPVKALTSAGAKITKRAYADVAAVNKTKKIRQDRKGEQKRGEPHHKVVERGVPEKDTCDNDGFIKVEKRRKKKPTCRNQCGTGVAGPNMLLRPAIPSTQLYVSRLHHSTKEEEIVEYIRLKTKWTLRVERLESRHNTNFKSYVVRVPTHHLETFLKEEFWPKGVVYRRFYGKLRSNTQRNVEASIK